MRKYLFATEQISEMNIGLGKPPNGLSYGASALNISAQSNSSINYTQPSTLPKNELFAWIVLLWILCLVGTISAILILLATWPRSNNKSGFNLLIFHFIFLNFLMCSVNGPIRIIMTQLQVTGNGLPANACTSVQTLYNLVWMAVNWSDAGLAINRCIALFFPMFYKNWSSKSVNRGFIVFAWVMSAVTSLPAIWKIGNLVPMNGVTGQCITIPAVGSIGRLYHGLTYLPYAVTVAAALLLVGKTYGMHRNKVAGQESQINQQLQKAIVRRVRLAKMLLLTILWGGICNFPNILFTARFQCLYGPYPTLSLWMVAMVTSQYTVTPLILLLSNGDYRRRLASACGRGRLKRSTLEPSNYPSHLNTEKNKQKATSRAAESDS